MRVTASGRGGPIALLDRLLDHIATVIHDRPVQQIVAAKLLLETGMGQGERPSLVDRGLGAIDEAGQLSRDIMWALATPKLRVDRLEQDLREMVSRAGGQDHSVVTSVEVAGPLTPELLEAVFAAVHSALADAVLSGRTAWTVEVSVSSERIAAEVVMDATPGPAAERVWVLLAATRIEAAGGWLETWDTPGGDDRSATVRHVRVVLPQQG